MRRVPSLCLIWVCRLGCTPQLHPAVPVLKEQTSGSYKTFFLFNLITPGSLPSKWRHKTFVGNSSQCKALCDYSIFALAQSSGSWPQQHMKPSGGVLKIVYCLGPVPRAATQNLRTSSEVMRLSVLPCPHLQSQGETSMDVKGLWWECMRWVLTCKCFSLGACPRKNTE